MSATALVPTTSLRSATAHVAGALKAGHVYRREDLARLSSAVDRHLRELVSVGKLQKLAVQSPYTFSEVTSYAKQLSAFSVPLDELYDTTKMLADVSAGLGVDMNRMILAYGQVRSASFLRGQEVRQFTEAGVPIVGLRARRCPPWRPMPSRWRPGWPDPHPRHTTSSCSTRPMT